MGKRGFVVSSLKRGYGKTGFCSLEPQVITEGLKNGVLWKRGYVFWGVFKTGFRRLITPHLKRGFFSISYFRSSSDRHGVHIMGGLSWLREPRVDQLDLIFLSWAMVKTNSLKKRGNKAFLKTGFCSLEPKTGFSSLEPIFLKIS